jgi:hypothetical protein
MFGAIAQDGYWKVGSGREIGLLDLFMRQAFFAFESELLFICCVDLRYDDDLPGSMVLGEWYGKFVVAVTLF